MPIILVKSKQYDDAVPYFKTAIKSEKNKLQRTRMKYLLGQIYAEQDQPGLAYKMFNEVAKASPPYELEFAARIRQTEVFSGANYQKVVKMLNRMAKSDKNKDYPGSGVLCVGKCLPEQGRYGKCDQELRTGY